MRQVCTNISQRLWTEFSGMTDNAKQKGLHGQKRYYYVFSIGTEHEHRGKGEHRHVFLGCNLTSIL